MSTTAPAPEPPAMEETTTATGLFATDDGYPAQPPSQILQLGIHLPAVDVAQGVIELALRCLEVGQRQHPTEDAELAGALLHGHHHLTGVRTPSGDPVAHLGPARAGEGHVDVAVADAGGNESGVLRSWQLRGQVGVVTVGNAGYVDVKEPPTCRELPFPPILGQPALQLVPHDAQGLSTGTTDADHEKRSQHFLTSLQEIGHGWKIVVVVSRWWRR